MAEPVRPSRDQGVRRGRRLCRPGDAPAAAVGRSTCRRSPRRRQSRRLQSPRRRSQSRLRPRRPITSGISRGVRDRRRSRSGDGPGGSVDASRRSRKRRRPSCRRPRRSARSSPPWAVRRSTGNAVERGPALGQRTSATRTRTARPEAGRSCSGPTPAASGSPRRRREASRVAWHLAAPTSTTLASRPAGCGARPDHRVEARVAPDLAVGPPPSRSPPSDARAWIDAAARRSCRRLTPATVAPATAPRVRRRPGGPPTTRSVPAVGRIDRRSPLLSPLARRARGGALVAGAPP